MKIIIDKDIPYIKGALEPFAEVVYLPGDLTTRRAVRNADGLITRTRTVCSKEILEGSRVRFIATATSGFDHIDNDYCQTAGIEWVNAPGCNAQSVTQYVLSALFSCSLRKKFDLKDKTIGIVGVGQVGSRLARSCDILGMKVLLNDPPRERLEGPAQFVPLQTIQQQADIISFHIPLNREGIDRTDHMVSGQFLHNLKKHPLIINTSRGEVFDSKAVCRAIGAGDISGVIIDCWENEPEPDLNLLGLADYVTPHIAGYSRDGKANGTRMSVRAVSHFFYLGIDDWEPPGVEPPGHPVIELRGDRQSENSILAQAILSSYNIQVDDEALRANPHLFEQFRGDYPIRREFDSYSIRAVNVESGIIDQLKHLGFKILKN